MQFKRLLVLIAVIPLNVIALSKAPIDITKMDISELENALNKEIISSELLVNLYLERIEHYKDYNAIITINEKAIDEAKKLDEERKKGKIRSQIHGIPIIVKDNIDVVGMPTTAGAKALQENYPNEDAEIIKKLKDAGAIVLAKSNMSEFAFLASSSRSTYGIVKNAYNPLYSSYGSSGGSSVAVALNLSPAAIGTDTNSSIRVPASASNLVGYRPTFGTISRSGILPYDTERDTAGLLTKTTNDSITLTNIIKGYDTKDSKSINQKYDKYQITLNSLNNITIGIPSNFLKGDNQYKLPENKETYNEIYDLMTKAINAMEKDGAKIVYLDEYYTVSADSLVANSYSGFLFCDSFNSYIKRNNSTIKSFEELTISSNKLNDLSNYAKWCNTSRTLDDKNDNKEKYKEYIEKIYNDNNLDVIVYPTTKNKLLKRGESGLINTSAHAASTLGFPAISMPLGFDSEDLPYGIEFMTLRNEDNKLFNITSRYEKINNISEPIVAPSLYDINPEVDKLIDNYNSSKKLFLKANWIKKVKEYFQKYNKNENVVQDAQKLNSIFTKRLYLNKFLKVVLILLVFLYIRKKFIKTRR